MLSSGSLEIVGRVVVKAKKIWAMRQRPEKLRLELIVEMIISQEFEQHQVHGIENKAVHSDITVTGVIQSLLCPF